MDNLQIKELSHNDFTLYFSHSYLKAKFPDSQDWEYIYFGDGGASGPNVTTIITGKREAHPLKTYRIRNAIGDPFKDCDDFILDDTFPKRGLYNTKGMFLYYTRQDMRQNCKGLTHHTSQIHNPFDNHLFELQNDNVNLLYTPEFIWNVKNLNNLFFSKYLDYERLLLNIRNQRIFGGAISNEFGLSQGIFSDCPTVWYLNCPIGEVDFNNEIKVLNTSFFQETFDFFYPLGIVVNR